MIDRSRSSWLAAPLAVVLAVMGGASPQEQVQHRELRIGILGLDTSHVVAFTRFLNDPKAVGDAATMRVVAGFPGGTDIPASKNRVKGLTEQLRKMGVRIVDSIPALLASVDAVLLESVDGGPHLAQFEQVCAAGKPTFIDKPLAGSLVDVLAIEVVARKHRVPWFSSSSLRFGASLPKGIGAVRGCDAWGPCSLEPSHPDLYWYGIHGVETLFTIMGPGCETVSRVQTKGQEHVCGVWRDGRIGTFRGIRDGKKGYGATVFGTKGIGQRGAYGGYASLVKEIARFFRTGRPPVTAAETVEIYAFMTAADASKKLGGRPVSIESVVAKAKAELARRR